jgi:molybdopterin synthase sulfur carrier subunit
MRILLFGKLADRAGRVVEHQVDAGGCTVAELRRSLAAALPEISDTLGQSSTRACVDQQMVGEDASVQPGQEIAFLPPLSGG